MTRAECRHRCCTHSPASAHHDVSCFSYTDHGSSLYCGSDICSAVEKARGLTRHPIFLFFFFVRIFLLSEAFSHVVVARVGKNEGRFLSPQFLTDGGNCRISSDYIAMGELNMKGSHGRFESHEKNYQESVVFQTNKKLPIVANNTKI